LILVLSICSATQISHKLLAINVPADNKVFQKKILPGNTVQQALESAQVVLCDLDRVHPSLSTELSEDSAVIVTELGRIFIPSR
jgi:uncharacterized protein YabE (DUF348 family)